MLKTSVETYSLRHYFGDDTAISMISDAGFDCIDYSFYWMTPEEYEKALGSGYLEYAEHINRVLKENNITCNQTHAPFEVSGNDSFDTENENYLRIVRAIEFSAVIGAKCVIVHGVYRGHDDDEKSYEDLNFRYYKSLQPYAERFGIKIAIENLFSNIVEPTGYKHGFLAKPELMKNLLERLDSDVFCVCVDVGHSAICGISPEDYISKLDGDILMALHLHDNDFRDDLHYLPFSGRMNWENIEKSLASIDYRGDITLEVMGALLTFPQSLISQTLSLAQGTAQEIADKIKMMKRTEK